MKLRIKEYSAYNKKASATDTGLVNKLNPIIKDLVVAYQTERDRLMSKVLKII